MSYSKDEIAISLGMPTGRRLEQPGGGYDDGVFGSISMFPRATKERIDAVRKNLPEIPDKDLDRSVDPWRDRRTRATYELLRGFFDIIAPDSCGVVAFTVSDGNILGLRPAGYQEEIKSVVLGDVTGGRA